MSDVLNLDELKAKVRMFADARNWGPFHNPKNLVMALSVEAAELVEIYQWLTTEQAQKAHQQPETNRAIAHEVADILLYLVCFADETGINLSQAVEEKMRLNAIKYPAPEMT